MPEAIMHAKLREAQLVRSKRAGIISQPHSELRRRLLWVILLRVIILTPVLGFASLLPQFEPLRSLLLVFLIAAYVFSGLSYFLARLLHNDQPLIYLQLFFDLVFIHLLVSYSEDLESVFLWLYLLLIAYSSIVIQLRGGLLAAVLSVFSLVLVVRDRLFSFSPGETNKFAVTLLGFLVVAYLGIYLAERLKKFSADLTESASSLANLRAFHENVISSIRSGLLTTDLQGHITTFNQASSDLMGYARDELLGKSAQLIFGERGLRKMLAADFERTRKPLRVLNWARTKKHRRRFLGSSVSPLLDKENQPMGFVVSFQDLTEIKRLEQEVAIKEKMAAVGSMAAGIAHEIRNPLGSMSGSIQLLRQELSLSPDKVRLMDIVLRESDRLNKIVEDFLSYAKPDSAEFAEVSLDEIIQDMLELLSNSAERLPGHDIQFIKRQPVRCLGNADQLRQVFWNLAKNSLRAMPEGGRLEIRLGRNAHFARVRIKDTGCGMTRQEVERIYHPFVTGFPKGLGLGMSIVYQIIENHRGKIQIRSEKGVGTSVLVSIPLNRG